MVSRRGAISTARNLLLPDLVSRSILLWPVRHLLHFNRGRHCPRACLKTRSLTEWCTSPDHLQMVYSHQIVKVIDDAVSPTKSRPSMEIIASSIRDKNTAHPRGLPKQYESGERTSMPRSQSLGPISVSEMSQKLPAGAQPSAFARVVEPKYEGKIEPSRVTNGAETVSPTGVHRPGHSSDQADAAIAPRAKGLTEASAYAKEVAMALRSSDPLSRDSTASAPPVAGQERRGSRPLPRPPKSASSSSLAPAAAGNTIEVIASSTLKPATAVRAAPALPPGHAISPRAKRPTVVIPSSNGGTDRLGTSDHRSTADLYQSPRSISTSSASALGPKPSVLTSSPRTPSTQVSPHRSSQLDHRVPVLTSHQVPAILRRVSRPAMRRAPGQRVSFMFVLQQTSIQAALLPFLPINSFLSLTGSSNRIRKLFTGETVGRWILKAWGFHLDAERGRSWPNLTVWEGFRAFKQTVACADGSGVYFA